MRVTRLIGVYNAEGTLGGELKYLVGRTFGRAHCSLCDVTHGKLREKKQWQSCRDALPVPFDMYHRNDQPQSVLIAAGNTAPVVVAETNAGIKVLLGPAEIDACNGSLELFTAAVEAALNNLSPADR